MRPEVLQTTTLALAEQVHVDAVLEVAAGALVAEDDVALARVWLVAPGDICGSCPMRRECPDQSQCLHLVASAGSSTRTDQRWSGVSGAFRRFPLGIGKIGKVGTSGTGMLLHDMSERSSWIVHPEWARSEGIKSLAVLPLTAEKAVLGVAAVFSRARIDAGAFQRLRVFADHVAIAVARARRVEQLVRQRGGQGGDPEIVGPPVGASPAWRKVLAQIDLVAPTASPVLITGEPGTGKELVARRIHARSPRARAPFVKLDCVLTPPARLTADLPGVLAAAAHGTLFVDEVSRLPPEAQSELHRARDVRVIAASNRVVERDGEHGGVRADVYHWLSVFRIAVPALRERGHDVAGLVDYFMHRAATFLGRPPLRLTPRERLDLERYPWPGNLRELAAAVERAVLAGRWHQETSRDHGDVLSAAQWRQRERANLEKALERARGRIYGRDGAATLLGVPPTTFASRLRALGIRPRV